jgi:predicted Fe-Mo cluster-binding NifX family protein
MIFAFGMQDEENLIKEHVGESRFFFILNITAKRHKLIRKALNKSPEEIMHGDPNKARAIAKIMQANNVKAIVGLAMGLNIKRMKEKFLPIILRKERLEDAIQVIQKHYDEIKNAKLGQILIFND